MSKKSILIFSDWFKPAYQAGGPITSIANFCSHLSGDYDLYVFTSNKDLHGMELPVKVVTDTWVMWQNHARVFYNSGKVSKRMIRQVLEEKAPDFVYLNSMFSFQYALLPLYVLYKTDPMPKTVLNPRGMLLPGALNKKSWKKWLFLKLFRRHAIWKKLSWQHSFEMEESQTRKIFKKIESSVVMNFPRLLESEAQVLKKEPGQLKLLFSSRIEPHKNLSQLIDSLSSASGEVSLSVYGPIDDHDYYRECLDRARSLPKHIKVTFNGSLDPEKLKRVYQEHHFFVLLSKGENFGHSIIEAFSNHRPVLVSNNTPWTNLEGLGIGWNVELANKKHIPLAIQQMIDMDDPAFQQMTENCRKSFTSLIDVEALKYKYRALFAC